MTSVFFRRTVHEYVASYVRQLLDPMAIDVIKLFSLLHKTKSVISGSFALRCLFPGPNLLTYKPNDLDIYVPAGAHKKVVSYIKKRFAYKIVKASQTSYCITGVRYVIWMQNSHGGTINVIVSIGNYALLPIFSFHSTMVMNFVSSTGIYSAYNDLTRSQLYIENRGRQSTDRRSQELIDKCLEKYHQRGFSPLPNKPHFCGYSWDCPRTIRNLGDPAAFFFPFASRPWLQDGDFVYQIFSGGGSVVWCFGGRRCNFSASAHETFDRYTADDMPFFALQCGQKVIRVISDAD